MKNCPTSNMNRSQLWGFEVSHIVTAFSILAGSNVLLNIMQAPLFISWGLGLGSLAILRIIARSKEWTLGIVGPIHTRAAYLSGARWTNPKNE